MIPERWHEEVKRGRRGGKTGGDTSQECFLTTWPIMVTFQANNGHPGEQTRHRSRRIPPPRFPCPPSSTPAFFLPGGHTTLSSSPVFSQVPLLEPQSCAKAKGPLDDNQACLGLTISQRPLREMIRVNSIKHGAAQR